MCAVVVAAEGAGIPIASVVRPDPRTGRLVRSVVVTPHKPSRVPATASPALKETVARVARENQLPPQLIHSVIQVESNYDPYAVSSKGALGLMQLIPATAQRFGVADVFDPEDNIQGGARYLKYLLGLYNGDDALALAAYNAGEGAVARYGGVPPYPETIDYVSRVRQRIENAAEKETRTPPPAVQAIEAKPADAAPAEIHNPIREVRAADGKVYYISAEAK